MRSVLSGAICSCAMLAPLSLGIAAHAQTPISDGQYVLGVPFVTTPPTGDVLLQELSSPYAFAAGSENIAGTLYSAVFSANGGATRDFFYQFTVTSGTSAVTTLGVSNFSGYNAAIGQSTVGDIDGTGNAFGSPFTTGGISSASSTESSGTISYFFDSNGSFSAAGTVPVGGESSTLMVRTNATDFTTNTSSIQSSVSGNVPILAPSGVALAPEPGAFALLAAGIIAPITGMIRRRRTERGS